MLEIFNRLILLTLVRTLTAHSARRSTTDQGESRKPPARGVWAVGVAMEEPTGTGAPRRVTGDWQDEQ